eukprot:818743-Amphidinium_carterae.1
MEADAAGNVRRSAVDALHSLGPNASYLAVPHLVKFLAPSDEESPEKDGDPCQVLRVLQNFGVAISREFEGQVHAAAWRHLGKTSSRLFGCDSRFNVRQRLLHVPPNWDWGEQESL